MFDLKYLIPLSLSFLICKRRKLFIYSSYHLEMSNKVLEGVRQK